MILRWPALINRVRVVGRSTEERWESEQFEGVFLTSVHLCVFIQGRVLMKPFCFWTVCLGVYCRVGSGLMIKYWECLNNMLGPGAIDRAHEQATQRNTGLSVSVTWICASNIFFHQLTFCYVLLDKQKSVCELNTTEFSCWGGSGFSMLSWCVKCLVGSRQVSTSICFSWTEVRWSQLQLWHLHGSIPWIIEGAWGKIERCQLA